MIQKLGPKLLWSLGFFIIFMILLPKTPLWYALESQLKSYNIIIDDERINENLSSLEITQGTLYFGNMQIARMQEATLSVWLLHNTLSINDLYFANSLKMLQGIQIKSAILAHSIITPLTLAIEASGSFGSLEGTIDLQTRKILLTIKPTAVLKQNSMIMRMLKKTKEGYLYAKTF